MKRSIFRTAAALFCAVACVCGLAACAKGEQKKAAENITLSKTELALEIGGEETLTATVTPEDASEKTVHGPFPLPGSLRYPTEKLLPLRKVRRPLRQRPAVRAQPARLP